MRNTAAAERILSLMDKETRRRLIQYLLMINAGVREDEAVTLFADADRETMLQVTAFMIACTEGA